MIYSTKIQVKRYIYECKSALFSIKGIIKTKFREKLNHRMAERSSDSHLEEKLYKIRRTSTDVMLMFPYFYTHAPKAMLFHPLGIAQLTAHLRDLGLNTGVIDCTFEDRSDVISRIESIHPRIVGISIMLSMSENAMDLANIIRQTLPETLLVCGGPLPTLKPSLFFPLFDVVFRGEADDSFPIFCRDYIESGATPATFHRFLTRPEAYHGLYYQNQRDKKLIQSPLKSSDEKSLDRLPMPDRSDYVHSKYQQFWINREDVSLASIMTSYGCPFNCEFCSKPIFGNRLRKRSMDRIFEEVRDIRGWGYDGLWIADDCFSLDVKHVRSFCRRLISEKLDMKWFCLARVDGISQSDIELWQASGCRKVFFGLESGSNEVLKLMNKNITTEIAEETLNLFAKSDIQTAGFFMVGYPGETPDTIETTFKWALSLPLDEISFTIPYPLPGTRLYSKVVNVDKALDWQYENENRMVYQSEFDEAYLRKRIDSVYEAFDAKRRGGKNP